MVLLNHNNNHTHMNTTTKTTLASIVSNLLNESPEGVTVKQVLERAEAKAKELGLTVNVNYRAVYQQLKAQGNKLSKGRFVAASVNEDSAIAA
jgi:hypothetical protein